jgi:signal transduction histidine kinase
MKTEKLMNKSENQIFGNNSAIENENFDKKIKTILENIPDMLFHLDKNGKFLSHYQNNHEKLHFQPEQFINKTIHEIFDKQFADKALKAISTALKDGYFEHEYELFEEELEYFRAKYAKMNETEVVVIVSNITRHKQTEIQLKELNANKDKLLSIISHDLRNPFSILLGMTELLLKNHNKYDSQKREQLITSILNSAKSAFHLTENLLKWSQLQSEGFHFLPVKTSVTEIFTEPLITFREIAAQKEITLKNSIPENLFVNVDKNMMTIVIDNLISNALKFTKKGGTVSVSARKSENSAFVEILITDTGEGICPTRIENLFTVGKKTSTNGTDNEKGSGLGLLICKDFTEKNGGKIAVTSQIGKGSAFFVTLPEAN